MTRSARSASSSGAKPKGNKLAKTVGQRRGAKLAKGFDNLRSLIPCYPPNKKLTKIETLRLAILYIKDLSEIAGTTDVSASPDVCLQKSLSSIYSPESVDSKSTCSSSATDESDEADTVDYFSGNERHTASGQSPLTSSKLLSGAADLLRSECEAYAPAPSHPSLSSFQDSFTSTQLANAGARGGSEEIDAMSAQQFLLFLQQQALATSAASCSTASLVSPFVSFLPSANDFENQWIMA